MASVGVFTFPGTITTGNGAGGNSTNNLVPTAAILMPISASVPSAVTSQAPAVTGSDTPPASTVNAVPTSNSASLAIANGSTAIATPLISMSPTPENAALVKSVPARTVTPTTIGGMFSETFKLVENGPFDEIEPEANGGRGSGNGSVQDSVNGYPLENGSLTDFMEQDCALCQ